MMDIYRMQLFTDDELANLITALMTSIDAFEMTKEDQDGCQALVNEVAAEIQQRPNLLAKYLDPESWTLDPKS